MIKVGVISLGCDKNRVDSEVILCNLDSDKFEITNQIELAQIIIVNTCAFLQAAREESISTVFNLVNMAGTRKIVLCGCLSQHYIKEMFDEFTEVSGFVGINDYDNINEVLLKVYSGERVCLVSSNTTKLEFRDRILTTPSHYAYLKIADGCDNYCSYCLIPYIRGRYRSRTIETLIQEVQMLVDRGVKELIIVAQDTTNYGVDLYGKRSLSELLRQLREIKELRWIRLLYCYGDKIDDELINEIKTNDKIVKYLDIPLQHASDNILKKMNRKTTKQQIVSLIDKLHNNIPDIVLRTTFIVGFPNETQQDINSIIDIIRTNKLQYIGVFSYSAEDGTAAAQMPNQIDEAIKIDRLNQLTMASATAIEAIYTKLIGSKIDCIIDKISYNNNEYRLVCRSQFQTPGIDGNVIVSSKIPYKEGQIVTVKIGSFNTYDLQGEIYEST